MGLIRWRFTARTAWSSTCGPNASCGRQKPPNIGLCPYSRSCRAGEASSAMWVSVMWAK
jgi:hypothetical protein